MFSKDPARGDAINPLMPHASMNTDIIPSTRLAYSQYKMIKLNRWGAMSPMERSLCAVFDKIETACTRAKIPNQVNYTTKAFFRRVYQSNLEKQSKGRKREGLRGPKRDGLIAACLYMAFKACDMYWAKPRLAKVFEITVAEVRRGIGIFWDLLKDQPLTDKLVKITGCKQYINWFSVELGLSRRLCTFACKLYKELKAEGIGTSKQPQSTASGCLWSVCQQLRPDIYLDRVVEATGTSKATIKDVERLMDGIELEALGVIFTREVCDLNDISNPLTRNKAVAVVKALFRLDGIFHGCGGVSGGVSGDGVWQLAAFAVYFVLIINDIPFHEARMLDRSLLSPQLALDFTKRIMPYRDAIIDDCVGGVYRASIPSIEDDDHFHLFPMGVDDDHDWWKI
jgi:transcription initiation factor TFIIIB Brf1 subunit/transcription initiation factor TFIIB